MIQVALHKKLNAPNGVMHLQVDFKIEPRTFVTLYGQSGAGKTSILRMLAGLMSVDEGQIIVHQETWLDTAQRIHLSPQKRKVGFVFQDYALFPNMTVEENLTFALTKKQDKKIIGDLIEIIELGNLKNRKPATLSGGQKQRVALARALVQKPQILMLDEPLAALDYQMRSKLQKYILQVHQEYGHTTILISHDVDEIIRLSDQVFILEDGKIVHQGDTSLLLPYLKMGNVWESVGEVIDLKKVHDIYTLKLKIQEDICVFSVDKKTVEMLKKSDKVRLALKKLKDG